MSDPRSTHLRIGSFRSSETYRRTAHVGLTWLAYWRATLMGRFGSLGLLQIEHCTVRPHSEEGKWSRGTQQYFKRPWRHMRMRLAQGHRFVMIGFPFSHETIQWYCGEMTFVFTVREIQYDEADAELWSVFGKKRRHRMVWGKPLAWFKRRCQYSGTTIGSSMLEVSFVKQFPDICRACESRVSRQFQ